MMDAEREAVVAENLHDLLRFAERINEDHGDFAMAERDPCPVTGARDNLLAGWKLKTRMAEGAFHNEQVAIGKLQILGGGAFP